MKRVVVLGGAGFFGNLIVERLAKAGLQPIVASRSHGELRIDANNADDLRKNLKPRDLVVDCAGPFQKRNSALIETARTMGVDIVDISDSVEYTSMVYKYEAPIGAAGIRVLTACSSLSTISAAVLKSVSVVEPRRLSAYLVPAIRHTATTSTIESVVQSLQGSFKRIHFPKPIGTRIGVTVKSVDGVTLPPIFPTLKTTELTVDLRFPGMNLALAAVPRWQFARRMMEKFQKQAVAFAKAVGTTHGVLGYEIASKAGFKYRVFTGDKSYMLAVLPAILAAVSIAEGRFTRRGLVPPTDHVDPSQLLEAVRSEGITFIAG
ncbi:MAG: saccharopine dehydrogenase NADP-binding domain-containing protein [Acidobacteriota bacterium]|nr:saccharopine dehydrogenase NADP-binding domain-containing protein [Acidobacteriota bacterium]